MNAWKNIKQEKDGKGVKSTLITNARAASQIFRVKQEQQFFSFYLRTTLLHAEIALFSKI